MRYQQREWDCGPAACANAAQSLGFPVQYWEVVKVSGAAVDGTSEAGVLSALRYLGLSARPYESNDRNSAWQWLHGALIQGRAVLLCVDSWSHWVAVAGLLGTERVVLLDSIRSIRNKRENGVHFVSHTTLMKRWWNARRWADGEKRLYAICVGKS